MRRESPYNISVKKDHHNISSYFFLVFTDYTDLHLVYKLGILGDHSLDNIDVALLTCGMKWGIAARNRVFLLA